MSLLDFGDLKRIVEELEDNPQVTDDTPVVVEIEVAQPSCYLQRETLKSFRVQGMTIILSAEGA